VAGDLRAEQSLDDRRRVVTEGGDQIPFEIRGDQPVDDRGSLSTRPCAVTGEVVLDPRTVVVLGWRREGTRRSR